MSDSGPEDEERAARRRAVAGVLVKAGAVIVVIAVLVALGTTVLVKALGLDDGASHASTATTPNSPDSPLPSSALPVPGQSTIPSEPSSSSSAPTGLTLSVSPAQVAPNQRINLTGTYPGHDASSLQVQRKQGGSWTDFAGVTAPVDVGTFATYVETSRTGKNVFRVYDPQSGTASNPVTVTVG